MKQALIGTIRREHLWEPGMHVAIAVSGGADSVALAHLLQGTAGMHGARLSLVHVDHGWSEQSASWAEHVRALGTRLGLPVQVIRVQCEPSEHAAREARYRAFEQVDADRIALAHHRDDQVETVLLHLLRGTHGRGLRGMQARRDRFVRPLLDVGHDALIAWCTRHDLPWIEDPANLDPRHLRTRLRALVTQLEAVRTGASASLARIASLQAEENAFLEGLASQLPLQRQALLDAPRVLRRRRLRQALDPITAGPLDAVLDLVEQGRGEVQLDRGRRVRLVAGRVEVDCYEVPQGG